MSKASPSSDPAVRRTGRRRLLQGFAALLLLAFALAAPIGRAQAQSAKPLDAPRIAGLVGERYDGYAVAHGKVSADIAALLDKVNAERRALYEKRAATDHVAVEAVQQIYAQQIRQSAPVGTWFLGQDGQWTQK
jgi:uncharacterized protein YdbL (DUF1318 family)